MYYQLIKKEVISGKEFFTPQKVLGSTGFAKNSECYDRAMNSITCPTRGEAKQGDLFVEVIK